MDEFHLLTDVQLEQEIDGLKSQLDTLLRTEAPIRERLQLLMNEVSRRRLEPFPAPSRAPSSRPPSTLPTATAPNDKKPDP